MSNYNQIIYTALTDNGIFADLEELESNIDLRDYIIDSYQYVSFIITLEDLLGIEFPDEFLQYDILSSVEGLVAALKNIVGNSK